MAGILGNIMPNGFMPAVRNNSDSLLQAGVGLLSGQTGPQQAALGAQGFAQARKQNRTMQFLQQQYPEIAAYVQAGMPPADALKMAYEQKLKAQTPSDPYSTIGKLQADLKARRITQEQYNLAASGIGKPGVEINMPGGGTPGLSKLGEGYTYRYNPDGTVKLDENGIPIAVAIPGGPKDTASQEKEKAGQAQVASQIVTSAADRARQAAGNRDFGPYGQGLVEKLPWTDSAEVARQVQVLKSQATIQNLNAMRAASPTGGALGNVTEKEGAMLAAKSGALDPSSPTFIRDLNDYELTLLQVIHGPEAGRRIFEQTMGGQSAAPNNGGTTSGGIQWSIGQ